MYLEPDRKFKRPKYNLIITIVAISACVIISIASMYVVLKIRISNRSIEVCNEARENVEEIKKTNVSTSEEVKISTVVNKYFNILNSGEHLSRLSEYCVDASRVATTERNYTSSSKYSYDTNDCIARGIRYFGQFVILQSVDSVVYSNGVYTVYCSVTTTSIDDLKYWYRNYIQDLTFFIQSTELTYSNLSKFMTKYLKNCVPPLRSSIYSLELIEMDNEYKIKNDSDILNLCLDPYISGISCLVDLVGSTLR